ncbi:endonuclease/exonuclease/phosphatase family protein [Aureimonas ureilytica]|uniref:endonuclease/exonuclease/phosphatase family protein n=1 Tax=Aureimonas ureilytica TaxID=401562 RepID=UPI0007344DCF|nr:endonuclease/exonuclease/phosphatase family protein [Aureimonas ureilytica]
MGLLIWGRRALTFAALAGSACIAAGFFGAAFHPFDSVSHFRLTLALALVLVALVAIPARAHLAGALAFGFAVLGLATTLPMLLPQDEATAPTGQPSYTLLQMNLLYDAGDKAEAIRRIAETRPDVVTLEEVTDEWRALFEVISERYPFQTYCGLETDRDGVAILSRRPFLGEALCQPRHGRVTQGVDLNGRNVAVTALHLDWPWPKHHWTQIAEMSASLPAGDRPALLGGDFNAAPWSAAVRAVANAAGLRIVDGIGPTWLTIQFHAFWPRWLGLPIDQLMVSPDIMVEAVETLARTSSDHLPVLLRFSVRPSEPPPPRSAAEPTTAALRTPSPRGGA